MSNSIYGIPSIVIEIPIRISERYSKQTELLLEHKLSKLYTNISKYYFPDMFNPEIIYQPNSVKLIEFKQNDYLPETKSKMTVAIIGIEHTNISSLLIQASRSNNMPIILACKKPSYEENLGQIMIENVRKNPIYLLKIKQIEEPKLPDSRYKKPIKFKRNKKSHK